MTYLAKVAELNRSKILRNEDDFGQHFPFFRLSERGRDRGKNISITFMLYIGFSEAYQ